MDDICIGESVNVTNNSVNAISHEWDFCIGDLAVAPTASNLASNATSSDILRPMDMTIVEENGNYYGFLPNRTGVDVLRFDFGTDLSTSPTPVVIENSEFAQPTAIKFYQDAGVWYALLTDFTKGGGNGALLRLTFGNGLNADPTAADDLGRFGKLIRPSDLVLASDTSGVYAFVTNSNSSSMTRIDFSGSYQNNPANGDAVNISVGGAPWGLEIVAECEARYGVVTIPASASNKVRHVSFPDGLGSAPTLTTIAGTFTTPYGIDLAEEGTSKYGVVAGQGANLYHLTFSGSFSDTSPTVADQGNFGLLTTPNSIVLASDSSQWYGFVSDEDSRTVERLTYTNDCGNGVFFSTDETPTGINYDTDGDYVISLTVTDADGDRVTTQQTLTVTANTSPDISFTIDNNRCILNDNTFTSSSAATITTYNWDFNGEGNASTSTPDFDFSTSGEKTITLDVVADNGCSSEVSETITIYEEPPLPNFDFTGSQCVSNALTFDNLTVDTDWTDVITYDWDFNSEGSSSDRDPTFTFATAGTKTVSVTSSIPGCTSTAYEETDIEIQASPTPSFSFTGNCGTGSTITFNDESGSGGLTYLWDFGDSNTSTDQNTTHSYATENTYTVSFTQTSSNGCSAMVEMDVVVSNASLASITSGAAEVNATTSFNGVDETVSGDVVTAWSWDFDNDDVEDANTQDADFVFTSAGDFTVSLMVTTSQGCTEEIEEVVTVTVAPCPTSDFSFVDDICIGEELNLSNISINAEGYEWDFCVGDLAGTPTAGNLASNATSSDILRPMDMTIVEENGNYYGFLPNRTGVDILRFDFGTDLSTSPTPVVIENSEFAQPTAIKFYQDAGVWYALLTDFTKGGGNGALLRLTFGNGLNADPTAADDLGRFARLNRPSDLVLASDTSGVYAFVVNSNASTITRIDFSGSYQNNPADEDASDLSPGSTPWGLEIIDECESRYGVVTLPTSGLVRHMSFTGGLGSAPTFTDITTGTFDTPFGIDLKDEGTSRYGVVTGNTGNLYHLTFSGSFSDTSPTVADQGNLGLLTTPNSIVLASDSSQWYGFVSDEDSRTIERLTYTNDCGNGVFFSTDETPTGINYDTDGDYVISLTVTDADGDRVTTQQTLTVTANTSPDISFTIDDNRCILNDNTFTSSSAATITTYNWDFNGEGNASTSTPDFDFSTSGEKTITLDVVADNGCSSEVRETITIYEEPPLPNFDFTGSQCVSNALTFDNLTVDTDWTDVITYDWDFNSEGSSSDRDPTFTFATAGTKTVSVTSSIPGCTSTAYEETDIEIQASPTPSFSFTGNCGTGSTITFNDESGSGGLTYLWDFGDSNTSTDQNTTHSYATENTYTVSFTQTSSNGCSAMVEMDVVVSNASLASITSGAAEVNATTSFNGVDETVSGDVVTAWSWDFDNDDVEDANTQDADFVFTSAGDFTVSLMVTTSQGCTEEIEGVVTVTVAPCPTSDFSFVDDICIGEELNLSNISTNAEGYEWDFCVGDLAGTPTAENMLTESDGLTRPMDLTIVEDGGNYYGFTPNRTGVDIIRLDFGNDLSNTPAAPVSLGNVVDGDAFSQPTAIKFYQDAGVWYALLTDFTSTNSLGALLRWTFGDGLAAIPTASESLGRFARLNRPSDLVLASDTSGVYAFVANSNVSTITRIDFSGSYQNNPADEDASDLSPGSTPWGLEIIDECESRYGVVTLPTSGLVRHMSFTGGLGSAPTFTDITTGTFDTPFGIDLKDEGTSRYGVVTGNTGNLYHLTFSGSFSDTSPTVTDQGNLGLLTTPNSIVLASDSSQWYGFVSDEDSRTIERLTYTNDCGNGVFFSTDETPTGISYETDGDYVISLTVTDADGDRVTTQQTLTVTANTSPDISFTIDDNRCILNDNTFTSSSAATITTYNWEFNGEGNASTSTPDFDFSTSGEKTITLDVVADNGCSSEVSETITIYEEPPVPNFDFTGSQCVSNALTFDNLTVDTDWTDVITYDWDFNSEGSSSDRDPTFTFATAGTKTVSVTSSIPGCTSTAYEETDIEIQASPTPSFSFTGNCGTGSTITFNDESGSGGLTYLWDFGDSNTSTDQNTTHSYATENTYTVSFTQTSSNGCSAMVEMDVVVSNASLASITSGAAEVNATTSFNGVDETVSGDVVTAWSWDFDNDDVEDANTQDADFVFTSAGDFTVSLMVITSQGCTEEIEGVVTVTVAPCPTSDFSFVDDICIGEELNLSNISTNAEGYEWDFCVGDLAGTPTAENMLTESDGLTRPMDLTIVEDGGNYYGFTPNRTGVDIIRLDFGNDLSNTPAAPVSLGNVVDGDTFSQPTAIKFYQDAGVWYALLTDFTSTNSLGALLRWTFGDGLAAIPTASESLGRFARLNRPSDLVLASDTSGVYAFVANSNVSTITRIDFSGSYQNNPADEDASDLSPGSTPWGLEIIDECESRYGVVTLPTSGLVRHMSFTGGLGSAPTFTDITTGTFDTPFGIDLKDEGTSRYGVVTGNTGNLYHLTFSGSFSDTSPTVADQGNLGLLTTPNSIVLASDSSQWYGFVSDEDSRTIERLTYTNDCGNGVFFSTDETPTGISYETDGDYVISLTVTDADGDRVTTQQTLTVTANTSPDISFTIDNSRCIDNSNTFAASVSSGLIYSWDFNGEGTGASSEETFQFSSAGEKTIALTVSDGTCSNSNLETITIYEAPPIPVFDISGNICESTSLSIANTTDDEAWSTSISYIWTFDGDSSVTVDQPDFAFTDSGSRSVSVISSIPGCLSEAASEDIVVNNIPNADYSISPTCDQEVTNYTNLTTGAATYSWDFGDGFTSTQQSPAHLYTAPGNYMIEMVATNSAGCTDTLTQEFSVDYLPVAGFRAQLPCEGLINLIDTSSVAASDIITWSYSVESIEQLFSDQNPELTLDEPGTYEVTQEVVSAQGCRSSVTQSIPVQDAADPNMLVDVACFGDSFHFTDISSVSSNNRVISRIWNFEGQSIEVEDTSTVEINHTFSAPGTYQVSLTLTTQNLCTSTISRTVEVLERPTLVFDVPQICQNDFASFTDLSQSNSDGIISRQWILNDGLIGNGTTVSHKFTVDGINEISLVTTTQQGCLDTLTRFVDVLPAPQASFEASDEFGVEGTAFSFFNTSTGSSTYQWLVDGSSVATTDNFDTIFNVGGNRDVELIAFSDFECSDTTSLEVLVRAPEIDVALTGMRLVPDDQNPEFSIIQVSVENRSNLPLDDLRFVVEIDDQLPIQNTENLFIPIGESRTTVLGVSAPVQASYICVEVVSTYDSEDINTQDNNQCINIEPQPVFPPAYPNPVRDEVSVDAVLPTEGDITISLLDISGKVELQDTYSDMNEGLQSFTLELSPFEPGMYFIKIEYGSFTEIKRIVKQ